MILVIPLNDTGGTVVLLGDRVVPLDGAILCRPSKGSKKAHDCHGKGQIVALLKA